MPILLSDFQLIFTVDLIYLSFGETPGGGSRVQVTRRKFSVHQVITSSSFPLYRSDFSSFSDANVQTKMIAYQNDIKTFRIKVNTA